MRSHYALRFGTLAEVGESAAVDGMVGNVVSLFAPREGSVATLIAAASAPAQPRELMGESEIRAAFRSAMLERPRGSQRRHRLAPFAIAAGSVAGLVAGSAGLSAAAVLPPAANHVVAQVLRHVGIDVAPAPTTAADPAVRGAGNASHATKSAGPSHSAATAPAATAGAAPTPARSLHRAHAAPPCNVATLTAATAGQTSGSCAAAARNHGTKGSSSSAPGTKAGDTGGSGPVTRPGGTGRGSGRGLHNGGSHRNGHHPKHGGRAGTGVHKAPGAGTSSGTGTGGGTSTQPLGSGTGTPPATGNGPLTSTQPLGGS